MSHHARHDRQTSPEPLPADFEAELQRIDDLLAANARSQAMPRGMLRRLESITMPLLGGSANRWRLGGSMAGSAAGGQFGRLALAASLALVFVAAAQFLTAPSAPPAEVEWLLTMGRTSDGHLTINALLDASEVMDHEVGYLLDMRGMDSSHVTSELDDLEAALGG